MSAIDLALNAAEIFCQAFNLFRSYIHHGVFAVDPCA